jgi:hypothetical protein
MSRTALSQFENVLEADEMRRQDREQKLRGIKAEYERRKEQAREEYRRAQEEYLAGGRVDSGQFETLETDQR